VASAHGGHEEEQNSVRFREDLVTADGRNETEAPIRALKEVSAERDDLTHWPSAIALLSPARCPWPWILAPRRSRPPLPDASLRRAAAATPPPRRRSDTSVAQGMSLSQVDLPSDARDAAGVSDRRDEECLSPP
jgi:hypothetical protein